MIHGGNHSIFSLPFTAGEDLSDAQWHAVKITDDGTVKKCGAGEAAVGVLQQAAEEGAMCTVMLAGVAKTYAGAAIDLTSSDKGLMVDANGRFVPVTTGNYQCATAIDSASADGDEIAVWLNPPVYYKTT